MDNQIGTKSSSDEIKPVEDDKSTQSEVDEGGGWGGWGFSSYFSDLQKAATTAAEEISRNAVEVAKTAAKSLTEMQNEDEGTDTSKEEESEDEDDKRRKASLEKLEKASEDNFLGQGLKALDNKVETFAFGAWQAFGNALKGGSDLVHKLENSAVNMAESIQQGGLPAATGSVAPSLLETGKAFTAKGMEVLELVGKETMDLLSIESEKNAKGENIDEDQFEEVNFDRCFYIYGGPEQLEELEALSNHYALLFNRRKAKLSPEQKAFYDGKLREIQQIFELSSAVDGSGVESDKGKKVDTASESSIHEMKNLYDSSAKKAAELAAGFANALAGLAPHDIVQRTAGRLDSLHSEGVHRLSEMGCFAVTHLLMLGKSIISNANKTQDEDIDEEIKNFDWPEDSVERAKIIRSKAQSINGNLEGVINSFITGISDVAEAYMAAIMNADADSQDSTKKSIQDKANELSDNLRADQNIALSRIQDGVQFLSYVVVSTSIPAA
ncbi:hypothetical protein LIER_18720 [Lithospermum erythrorhizon]|uniref:DUF7798 domain-containing protein n=1 Tax=Lithospermum erythrorhizon TaxID=34254 RepID=A0AAV3QG29_LITER